MSKFAGRASASIDRSSGDGYEVWTISGKEVYDLSDGEELSNVLVDQTASGACLTIRSRNRSDWTVRNVGFVGVGQAGNGGNRFQFQVSTPSGGHGLIENVWANGKARDGQSATELGGIYIRSGHAGHIDVRNTYIEGFGNNAVYGSAPGKDSGDDGSVTCENCYHRDNTVSQFRIGSPDSVVRNCVGVVDDPDGDRGWYPNTSGNRNARGVWGKHYRNQRVENSSFYISPDDDQPDGIFEARYISDRSHGPEAVVEVVDCNVNADAPAVSGSTSNARVEFTNLGENPTVQVIGGGGVPTSPEMAARGEREMPPELPGADGGSGGSDDSDDSDGSGDGSGNGDSGTELDRTLTIDGSGAGWTDYEFTVSETIENDESNGSFGGGDAIEGSTASGFVNGGVDGYLFSGEITDATVDGDAAILVDGDEVDPSSLGGGDDSDGGNDSDGSDSDDDGSDSDGSDDSQSHTLAIDGNDAGWTDYEFTVSEAIENDEDVGTFGGGDAIEGTTATGFVNGGVDGYLFSGEITDATVDGDAAILVDGDEVDPSSLGGDDGNSGGDDSDGDDEALPRTLAIDGGDADPTDYEFAVSGDLESDDGTVEGSTATGSVDGDVHSYTFSGDVVGISVDGDATVVVDDEAVDPASLILPNHIVFDGKNGQHATTYAIEVGGELVHDPLLGTLEDGDSVDGSTATGSVSENRDGFRFSGNLLSLQLDGEASLLFEDSDG